MPQLPLLTTLPLGEIHVRPQLEEPLFSAYELDRGPMVPRDAWIVLAVVAFVLALTFGCGFVSGVAHEQAEHPITAEVQ